MAKKIYREKNVLDAARDRIRFALDRCERAYIAYSGGKDSTVMMHLVMEEAIKRGIRPAVMFIDMEAQYKETIDHAQEMFDLYADNIEPHWVCIPMPLRNAVTNYEPKWMAWEPGKEDVWIRPKPHWAKTEGDYPFGPAGMEFEEFIVAFGEWYGAGENTAAFIGIRADESLHRYCAVATWEKRDLMLDGARWTTRCVANTYNCYPIYDWRTEDIWTYHAVYKDKPHNRVYDKMQMAGVPISQQRLCQPFGDDQRRGLWLYHILEPQTWFKLVARLNGVNSGALYVSETGNISGYNKISKPDGHTWRSFCNLLLQTMPQKTRAHYLPRFKKFIHSWHRRGYVEIPDEAPPQLEAKCWAPSWRRMCKVLLRNDYWCKGLGQSQPKTEAWARYKEMKRKEKAAQKAQESVGKQEQAALL